MTKELHKITISFGLDVNLRTNGDGFAYYRVKEKLQTLILTALAMTDPNLIIDNTGIELKDEVIE